MTKKDSPPVSNPAAPREAAASLRREGNTCFGLGAGVGALGIGSAVAIGATCPLCFFVAPALLGMGAYGHIRARKVDQAEKLPEEKNLPDEQ